MVRTLGRAAVRGLDAAYLAAGVLAGGFLVAIFLLILAAIVTRLLGVAFPGAADYAGYCMAAASFFALAHTFRRGAHIRVSLVLQTLPAGPRRVVELASLVVAGALAWYFAWYAVRAVGVSRLLGDVSQGQDATPLWIPQLAMAAGTILLVTAICDHLLRRLLGVEGDIGGGEEI